jgi:hypothetical protein
MATPISDEEMKKILCEAIEKDVVITVRTQDMTDEEYKKKSDENKALGLAAVREANHEQLGRIVNALRFAVDREQGKFDDLK